MAVWDSSAARAPRLQVVTDYFMSTLTGRGIKVTTVKRVRPSARAMPPCCGATVCHQPLVSKTGL